MGLLHPQVSPVFGTIFNMVYFVAKAVEERRLAGGGHWVTGSQLFQSDGGFEFQGFNQVKTLEHKSFFKFRLSKKFFFK